MRKQVLLSVTALCGVTAVGAWLATRETQLEPASITSERTTDTAHPSYASATRAEPANLSTAEAVTERRATELPSRIVAIRVLTHSGRFAVDVSVVVERRLHHGAWVQERQLRTDAEGLTTTRVLEDDSPRRARIADSEVLALLRSQPAITELRIADTSEVWIELVDAESRPLPGARSVLAVIGHTRYRARAVPGFQSQWRLAIAIEDIAKAARVSVTDTLGQTWHRELTPRPIGVNRVAPPPGTAVLRSIHLPLHDAVRDYTGDGVRLRWSLQANGKTRAGSTWLRCRGFHAVAHQEVAPANDARLELRAVSATSHPVQHVVDWPLVTDSIDIESCKSRFVNF